MKAWLVALVMSVVFNSVFTPAFAKDETVKMDFKETEITKIIESYAKAAKQKFIIDPAVRGKATILLPEAVSIEEAFNHLSTALALNGYAISKQGDTMVVKAARNIQRDLIEVGTEVPAIKPERMFVWIYPVKGGAGEELHKNLRTVSSKDGEYVYNYGTKQLVITDWVTNINRVAAMLKELDKPTTTKK